MLYISSNSPYRLATLPVWEKYNMLESDSLVPSLLKKLGRLGTRLGIGYMFARDVGEELGGLYGVHRWVTAAAVDSYLVIVHNQNCVPDDYMTYDTSYGLVQLLMAGLCIPHVAGFENGSMRALYGKRGLKKAWLTCMSHAHKQHVNCQTRINSSDCPRLQYNQLQLRILNYGHQGLSKANPTHFSTKDVSESGKLFFSQTRRVADQQGECEEIYCIFSWQKQSFRTTSEKESS